MAIEIFPNFTVVSDVGPTANSYISVEDTKALWELDPFKQGTTLTDEEIGRAVITATSQLNNKYGSDYLGSLYDDTYALFYPRKYITDSRGVAIDDFTIFPVEVANATGTQAWYSGNSNRNAEATLSSGVIEQKMDGLGSIKYESTAAQKNAIQSTISDESALVIAPYISGGNSKYTSLIMRG